MAATRRLLDRIPADRLDWKPHTKSRSLGELATHVTELARWGIRFQGLSFQVGTEKAPAMASAADFVKRFDENVAQSRAAIQRTHDAAMEQEFRVLKPDGSLFFALKRQSLLRRILINHLIHHRGQLTVYLRSVEVPLPPIYGPTADEPV